MSEKPISLEYHNFRGLYSVDEAGIIPSDPATGVYASAIQNAVCEDGTITFSQGYEEENNGTTLTTHQNGTDNTYIRQEFLLYKRNGVKINLAWLNNGKIEWKNTVLNRYETLLTGLTTGVDLGVQEFNTSGVDRTYFCDGTNNLSFWNKSISYYASDNGSNTITVTVDSPATTLATAGFAASGTIVLKDGTAVTYSGISGLTFTGCSAVPATPTVGDGIAQQADITTLSAAPKGNILFVYQARLGIVVEASPTVVRLSAVADGTDFTTAGVAGTITANIVDGNGRIQGVTVYDKRVIFLKENGVIPVQIIQIDSSTLRTNIEPLVLYQNVGPDAKGQVFSAVDEVFWVSAENDIKRLSTIQTEVGVTQSAAPITDTIKKTLQTVDLTPGRMYFANKRLLVTCKTNEDVTDPDTVLHYDYDKKTFYFHKRPAQSFWTDQNSILHFTSPSEVKSYRMFSGFDADGAAIGYLWKSGRLNMGSNFYKKGLNIFVVYGQMTKSSTLNTQIDFNSGALGSLNWNIKGDGSSITRGTYMITSLPGNQYGLNVFGITPYGGEVTDSSGLLHFLYFKSLPARFRPYDVYVSFSASAESNNIKIFSFGLNPKILAEIPKYKRS